MTERRTRQLAAVSEVLRAAHDHPTADEVHRRVRRKLPRVSLGTVYRNLEKLAARREVRVVQLTDRAARFDGMLDEHDHFLCEGCGTLTDLVRKRPARPTCSALQRAGYTVREQTVTVYGLCPRCGAKQRSVP